MAAWVMLADARQVAVLPAGGSGKGRPTGGDVAGNVLPDGVTVTGRDLNPDVALTPAGRCDLCILNALSTDVKDGAVVVVSGRGVIAGAEVNVSWVLCAAMMLSDEGGLIAGYQPG